MTRCKPRSHVLADRGECDGQVIRHRRPDLAATYTGYKTDGCRCCDCRAWNRQQRRRERGQAEPAAIGPERPPKPPRGARTAREPRPPAARAKRAAPEPRSPAPARATRTAPEPETGPGQEPLLVSIGKLIGPGIAFKPPAPITLWPQTARAVTATPLPIPESMPLPVSPRPAKFEYDLRPNTHDMCELWERGGHNCATMVTGQYLVSGRRVCYEHYEKVRQTYPSRAKYRNTMGELVKAPLPNPPTLG